ncbi:hypothetical protein SAMN04487897_12527 [Paenibacillus sp. yr247]|uniref:DUF2357 domain-containing protein n=1 Tax=Paenibacillus sp. yr247 TaxID=1761880 RepID=UPI00088714C2|nr:DUF2357 domain-containing protein [Paenibacillus sp. yr247]SDO87384.1 hypothetical protein SAMN04487897_12527 [Paenibacillus sp. yr247]
MAQLSFGGNFLLRQSGEPWLPVDEAYLIEATTYEWKFMMIDGAPPVFRFCGLQHFPHKQMNGEAYGVLTTPFHSGQTTIELNGETFISYIYPDPRKMTQDQYSIMLSDILQEAALCFEDSEIATGIDANERSRELSWAQWSYLEASLPTLKSIIKRLLEQPTRMLLATELEIRRERIKTLDTRTIGWLERNIGRSPSGNVVPEIVRGTVREDSFDTYENKVIKKQLIELRHLLKLYTRVQHDERARKAEVYADQVGYWLRDPILKQVTPYQGTIRITQIFRKHPVYRQCYQWFDRLNKLGNERIGFQYNYPLKETFVLYEIWCYMQLVKVFREKGLLQDSTGLFKMDQNGLFLNFSEHNESVVKLANGMRLYYQRVYQYNSPHFYTFTQQMKPDIVIEAGDRLYILDPKYRVPTNLSTALGEMHKYRDGILLRSSDERAVERVFIITPVQSDELRYFSKEFHEKYRMGAIGLTPGAVNDSIGVWVDELLNGVRKS